MVERQVSAMTLVASVLWALSVAMWGLGWIFGSEGVGRGSLLVCGVAVTVSVRCLLAGQDARMRSALAVTNAVIQAQGEVRNLR